MADKPKLTRAERKQIEAVIRKYRGDGKPHTAQDTIPYQIMYPDGICYLGNRHYSQSIEFFDINYLLAQPDDQTAIFEYLCDLYNYLDSSIHVQFTYPNRKSDREQLARSFEMPPCNDGLDPIRQEQTDILKRQLARGNNGSVKTKYITYTIEADNLKAARARLSRISLDIQGYFKIMGAVSRVLDGKERLEVLHGIMHPDGERFNFDWKWLAAGGLSTKDFIAPSSFAFKNSRMFQMGGKLCAASFLQIITPELTDRILTDFLDTDSSLVVNVHIQALEQTEAVKMVKRKITDLDAMKIQEQKKAVRDGYDMDILPSDLATYGGAAKKLLQDLQSRNERYFLLTFLVLNYGDTKRKLENEVFRTAGVAQKHNCTLTRLDFQQERGLVSSLPLGENQIHITRGMTTSAVAIIVPFVTQELFQGGDSLYYGLNAKSGNMIMLDRKNARSPNGLVFGTPGGGKSFSCKREMIGVLLKTHDHVLVCDPEGDLGTTAVIGGFYTEANQLYDSYIEAFALERKRCFYEYSGVFYVEDATEEQQENGYLLQNDDFIQRLVAAMRQNQRSLVKEMLRTFADSLALLQPSREQFLLQINQVSSALLDFAMEYGVTETVEKNSKLFSSDYIEISSVSEIQTELIRYGEQILQQVHLSKNSSNSAIVRRTKEYIKAHYQDDELCLEQIADALDVNLQYMCFLFKKQTDTTIGAYILQTRMVMAGRLFQRTNYNVTEVAQRVGFFDVSYFSKCFKKYFGVSPKQYQNVSSNYLKTT